MMVTMIPQTTDTFQLVCLVLVAVMLVWNTVEVGRNDAANLVNAVFGARVLTRRKAVAVAGIAVVLGAVLGSAVIDTARKGIFHPPAVGSLAGVLSIYVSVYIVNTVLLYSYSAFGMPVSTTHVSCGSLFGIGVANGHGHWRTIGGILLAWVTTLPVAATVGGITWTLLA